MRVFLAKLLLHFFALLPLSATHFLGSVMGRVGFYLPNKLKHPMKRNIELCFPHLSSEERRSLYKNSFIETYKSLAEAGPLWIWNKDKILSSIQHVSGENLFKQAFAKGNGVILALPHIGAWEILGIYCAEMAKVTALYKPVKLDGLNTLIKQSRERNGTTLVPTNRQGVRSLFEALSRNELVIILPDQDPGKEGSVFAPFCGIPANTMTLLPRLANKTGASVVFGYAERLAHGRGFVIHFLPAPENAFDKDLTTAATQLNSGIENCLRMVPQQYQWGYRRFKRRPPGESRIY